MSWMCWCCLFLLVTSAIHAVASLKQDVKASEVAILRKKAQAGISETMYFNSVYHCQITAASFMLNKCEVSRQSLFLCVVKNTASMYLK